MFVLKLQLLLRYSMYFIYFICIPSTHFITPSSLPSPQKHLEAQAQQKTMISELGGSLVL